MLKRYLKRTILGLSLVTQAFLYNAVFFTEALVLTTFFGVAATTVPVYIIPLAVGNLIGPWLLGRYFDTLGRRVMISGTHILSGLLLVGTGLLPLETRALAIAFVYAIGTLAGGVAAPFVFG